MKVEKNKVVELIYELVVDGKIADSCTEERPLSYIHGTGSLLEKFEAAVEGLEPEGAFAFTLAPEEGYGVYDPERFIEFPKEAFVINGMYREDLIVIGNTIPLVAQNGAVVPGVITEIAENSVKIDLNHPMAGKTLNFSGKVITVRDATEKELTEGLHGERASQGCGGGGCHGGGCHGEGKKDGCHGGGCHGEGDGEGCCHGEGHGEGCGCGEEGGDCDCGCQEEKAGCNCGK